MQNEHKKMLKICLIIFLHWSDVFYLSLYFMRNKNTCFPEKYIKNK